MRLVTYSINGVFSIGVELDSGILDIPEAAARYGVIHCTSGHLFPKTLLELLQWESGIETVSHILQQYLEVSKDLQMLLHPPDNVRLEAPILRPGKIIALGLNYRDHIQETGRDVPEFPVVFAKFPSSVVGPGVDVKHPKVTRRLDWEVELGVVIGKTCREVSEKDALEYIAGYTVINDLTARDLQKRDKQWVRGKSLDGLCPMGPCIVTRDELGDGSGLRLYSKVNGEIKQDSTTSNLLFSVPQIVSFLSQSFTLEPGDVIATGTPSGVGFARDPPEYLKPGDEVEVSVERIGVLRNRIV